MYTKLDFLFSLIGKQFSLASFATSKRWFLLAVHNDSCSSTFCSFIASNGSSRSNSSIQQDAALQNLFHNNVWMPLIRRMQIPLQFITLVAN